MSAFGNAPPGQLSGDAARTAQQSTTLSSDETSTDHIAKALQFQADANVDTNYSSSVKGKSSRLWGWVPFPRKSSRDQSTAFGGRWAPPRSTQSTSQLTFFERYFTKPVEASGSISDGSGVASDSESERGEAVAVEKGARDPRERRRFAWGSRGTVVSLAIASLIVLIVIITLAVVLTENDKRATNNNNKVVDADETIRTPADAADTQIAFSISQPPVRLGALTNFPDPSIYYDGASHMWYAVGSNEGCGILGNPSRSGDHAPPPSLSRSHVQIATSRDFNSWQVLNYTQDPLKNPGNWVKQGDTDDPPPHRQGGGPPPISHDAGQKGPDELQVEVPRAAVWAPDIFRNPKTNQFVMYYSAAAQGYHHHCIGAASATAPQGPYTAQSDPIACPVDQGGAIDPAPFVEPGTNEIYMAYKVDGNSIGHGGDCNNMDGEQVPTPILLQRMNDDGLTPLANSPAVTILDRTPEDGPLVEAPSLVKVGAVYYLFFSSGCTRKHTYNLKYATADNVAGPYTRAASPLISPGQYNLTAPGSATVRRGITNPGQAELSNDDTKDWKIVLHSRVHMESKGGVRALFTSGLEFDPAARTVKLVDGSAST